MPAEKLTPARRRELTRNALLDAAEEVFARRGVSAAAFEEIAAEAGFSRGALYDHFGSKDELLLAVQARFSTRQLELFEQLNRSDEPAESAATAATFIGESSEIDRVPLELELRMSALRHPEMKERLVEVDRRASAAATRLVHRFVGDAAELRLPAEDLADLGRAATIGLLLYAAIDDERRERYERLIETMFVLLSQAIVPKGRATKGKEPKHGN